ncbi:MAG: hypothetical protein HY788_14040 [Deltaproteobacteria bacterium]|nr:hypothetical protein [Deltaproteobacteria bacterium]
MNIFRAGAIGAVLLTMVFLGGCSKEESSPEPQQSVTTSSDVKKEMGEAVQALKDYTYEQRDEYLGKIDEQLDRIDARIEELKEKIETKSDEVRQTFRERIDRLKESQAAAREELDKLRDSSGDAWNEMMKGMQDALDKLEEEYKSAAAELS